MSVFIESHNEIIIIIILVTHCCLFVQLLYAMMNTSLSQADHRSPTADDVDDSCIAQYIEIVPLDISRRNDFGATEVKDEIMMNIKQEPEDQYKQCGAADANVSLSSFTQKL